ncbi:hypothetical protein PIB30_007767 [Stylosanthes scabra]|uniref:Uncharacterized protein n=1 Tax=Stylosanthes scabra TaxID=79078 RepID=A0ABU6Z5A4_9FABA|nr:hypothetical protein [Stylosanthes scabra]
MNERKLDINAPLISVRRSSVASSLPSLIEAKRKVLEKRGSLAYYLDQVAEPVAVPFNWEHIPGTPKANHGSQLQPSKDSPSLPPGKSTNVSERKKDDDDDVYSDALETLSSTESASMKCSASGVSGLDNFDSEKHGSNAAADKQAQDFMMNRFLPAAKAMTVHPPQYASSRKQQSQSVLAEQPRDIQRLVREERKSIVNKHITELVPYTGQFQDEEESDDGDDGYGNSSKGCGMFSRLGVRSSLCLLNAVPGMKMKDEYNMSCAYEYGKPIKKAWGSIQKSKSERQESSRKWRSESERFSYSGESERKQLGGSGRISSFRRSRTSFQSKPHPLFPRHASATTSSSSVSCSADTTTQRTEDTMTMFDAKTVLLASKENNQEQEDKAQRLTTDQESMSLLLVQSSFEKETKIDNSNSNKQIVAVDHPFGGEADLIPAPLLPKSPSDSWLRRALPLVYMKNSGFPHSNGENKFLNASSRFVKWETKVKTWNMHDGHANCCQELTVYKPQHSKY